MAAEVRKSLLCPDRSAVGTHGNARAWDYAIVRSTFNLKAIRRGVRDATPDNATLRSWASERKAQPPQEWYDETANPFSQAE